VIDLLRSLFIHRAVVATMAGRELRLRYAGTVAGLVWSVLPQVLALLVYWFVFSVGLKVTSTGGIPFIATFACGFVAWSLFNETVMGSSGAVQRNVHLVKKAVFPTEILPASQFLASLAGHGIMLAVLCVLLWANGMAFSIYGLQVFYYAAGLGVFSIGLGLAVSSVNVLMPDLGHALAVLMNIWFWLTPIVWDVSMLPEALRLLFSLNPVFYIVDGYRASLIYHAPFWQNTAAMAWFWTVSLVTLAAGAILFQKLKAEFAEVL
jgi:lipopolysaccharide transport system permease protein/teichoic acid transport system permease protein